MTTTNDEIWTGRFTHQCGVDRYVFQRQEGGETVVLVCMLEPIYEVILYEIEVRHSQVGESWVCRILDSNPIPWSEETCQRLFPGATYHEEVETVIQNNKFYFLANTLYWLKWPFVKFLYAFFDVPIGDRTAMRYIEEQRLLHKPFLEWFTCGKVWDSPFGLRHEVLRALADIPPHWAEDVAFVEELKWSMCREKRWKILGSELVRVNRHCHTVTESTLRLEEAGVLMLIEPQEGEGEEPHLTFKRMFERTPIIMTHHGQPLEPVVRKLYPFEYSHATKEDLDARRFIDVTTAPEWKLRMKLQNIPGVFGCMRQLLQVKKDDKTMITMQKRVLFVFAKATRTQLIWYNLVELTNWTLMRCKTTNEFVFICPSHKGGFLVFRDGNFKKGEFVADKTKLQTRYYSSQAMEAANVPEEIIRQCHLIFLFSTKSTPKTLIDYYIHVCGKQTAICVVGDVGTV